MMRRSGLLLLVAMTVAPAARAEYVVFADGRYLHVAAYRFRDGEVQVDLDTGGKMAFGFAAVRFIAPDADVDRAPAREPTSVLTGVATVPWTDYADARYVEPIRRAASAFEVDPALIAAVCKVESDFRPNAVSPKGAAGLMQLMPLTARELAVADPFDAEANLYGGTRYLRQLIDRYEGSVHLALAAYNAGPTAVDTHAGIPPYAETQNYVRKVLALAGPTPTARVR